MLMQTAYQYPAWALVIFLLIAIWDLVWRSIALWHSARHTQKKWFVCLVIFNTLGLLPIIYLLWFKPREKNENIMRVESASKNKARRKNK